MQATSDVDSSEEYKLLIHSLTHEHTQFNGGRHLLLMQKWIRDNEEGSVKCLLKSLKHFGFMKSLIHSFFISLHDHQNFAARLGKCGRDSQNS